MFFNSNKTKINTPGDNDGCSQFCWVYEGEGRWMRGGKKLQSLSDSSLFSPLDGDISLMMFVYHAGHFGWKLFFFARILSAKYGFGNVGD